MRNSLHDEVEKKMFDHIRTQSLGKSGPNSEASMLFLAIQQLFDGLEGEVIVSAYLVHNLAACAWVALEYDHNQRIPWDRNDHDYIILRAFRGLLRTLGDAIRGGRTKERDKKTYYGNILIPEWYVDYVQQHARNR
jgi:hypothetical protein